MTHSHIPSREKNVKTALFLNIAFVLIELVGGVLTNSLTILSDALHDFGDAIALLVAWIAEKGAKKHPDAKRTFGYQRLSLAASLITATVLGVGSIIIFVQAIPRLLNPEHVNAPGMIGLAILGIVFNGFAFLRLRKGGSMNERMLTWHFIEDILGWVVILVGSTLILFWDNHLIDPLMTLGYTLFIVWGVGKNLKEVVNILMQGVPAHIDIGGLKQAVLDIEGVTGIHDVHVWSLEGETDVFTGHVVIQKPLLHNHFPMIDKIRDVLSKHHIEHSTIELEDEDHCSGIECEPHKNDH